MSHPLRPFLYAITAIGILTCSCRDQMPGLPDDPAAYTDPEAYGTPFTGMPDTRDLVLYEVNQRSFPGGDFEGVIGRLDAIADLGVNALWLMPIHPIGTTNSVNSPYSVEDYRAVSEEYGNLEDLRRLVEEAHNRGMAVILDWVANHTSWDHAWIEAHPEYYTQVDSSIVHPPGTNWLDVADLNFDHPDLRIEMIRAMKYWILVANVDGYRCDAADFVPYSFWKQALDTLRAMPDRNLLMLAEGANPGHWMAGFDLNWGWSYYGTLKEVLLDGRSAKDLRGAHNGEYFSSPDGHHRLRFTTNHDESAWDATPPTVFGSQDAALAAFTASTFMGGVPLIYGSQEVGREGSIPFFSNSPTNWSSNPDVRNRYQALMDAYSANPAWRDPALRDFSSDDVLILERGSGSSKAAMLVNLRNAPREAGIPSIWQGLTATDGLTGNSVTLDSTLLLNAFEYRLLEDL
jgi:1,4-alpha-glucan branching enzyme